jgi:hypothetical protein
MTTLFNPRFALAVFAAATLLACGSTVGDPCTTAAECGNQLCLNKEYTPGGYCSKQCTPGEDDTCPAGTTCVRNGAANDLSACFRVCKSAKECRAGYACQQYKESSAPVCVGSGT